MMSRSVRRGGAGFFTGGSWAILVSSIIAKCDLAPNAPFNRCCNAFTSILLIEGCLALYANGCIFSPISDTSLSSSSSTCLYNSSPRSMLGGIAPVLLPRRALLNILALWLLLLLLSSVYIPRNEVYTSFKSWSSGSSPSSSFSISSSSSESLKASSEAAEKAVPKIPTSPLRMPNEVRHMYTMHRKNKKRCLEVSEYVKSNPVPS
mmetsp:Transcript_19250/g.33297  ORF Transcript_19250/g.33297 Transcript_19250/m.33297 type:complete len:206 (+) Transcript_19250:1728-2345(+)